MKAKRSVADRFWEKVDKSGGPSGCWTWTATRLRGKFPYGRFVCRTMSVTCPTQLAHRVSYELSVGPIPHGMCVLHRCDNPPCVNPAHLFLGTYADNHADCKRKGRNLKATGDKSGARLHPERVVSGNRHWTRMRPESVLKGETHGGHKLTEDRVRQMRSLRDDGRTLRSLADAFGVSKKLVLNVTTGRTWRHVK